jgi:cell division protein FtsL
LRKDKIKKSQTALRKEKSFRLKFFLILMILISLSTVYIWQRVTVLTLANEIKRLNVEIGNQQREYKYVQVEVASLSSVERIERLAQEMGFIYPSLGQIEILSAAPNSGEPERESWIDRVWGTLKGTGREILSLR